MVIWTPVVRLDPHNFEQFKFALVFAQSLYNTYVSTPTTVCSMMHPKITHYPTIAAAREGDGTYRGGSSVTVPEDRFIENKT
jgi:hypothetical protein